MVNFLSAVGRAKPATAIQDFQIKQGNILGQEKKRAVADLNIANAQQQMEIRGRKEAAEIENINQEKETLASKMNVFTHPTFMSLTPTMQKHVSEAMVQARVTDEQGIGTVGDVRDFMVETETTSKGIQTILAPIVAEQKANLDNIQLQISEEMGKDAPNQKKIETLTVKRNEIAKKYSTSSVGLSEALGAAQNREKAKAEQQDAIELENLKQEGRVSLEGIKGADGKTKFSPTTLSKSIAERQAFLDGGMSVDNPIIQAFDDKIFGTDIDTEDITDEEIEVWGKVIFLTGKMPSLGRGKEATSIRKRMVKSAARLALGAAADGIPDIPGKTPAEAAFAMVGAQSDTKSIQGSLNFLDKQLSSMGSFVTNLNSQVDRVGELSKDLKTFDTRLLNVPLRTLRGRVVGSPIQAKYDLFLTEIESEIGKLATGSTASIAELSATAQEKWSKIHDKNLSVKDMLELLEETKTAANLRVESVKGQLEKTRKRIRTPGRDIPDQQAKTGTEVTATNPETGETLIFRNGKWESQ